MTAWLTCSIPALCSTDAAVISVIVCATRSIDADTERIASPARSTSSEPPSICATDSSISSLISFADCALRCASARTSPATTAKPRPSSPARAASTAAFSARMLVWNAMPSITAMISAMRPELRAMPCILSITSSTIAPPFCVVRSASSASALAARALSLFCRTVAVSSSMLAAVCSSEAAWLDVRADKSALPLAISAAPRWIAFDALRTTRTVPATLACMSASPRSSRSISYTPRGATVSSRRPCAIRSKCTSACASGATTARRATA
ncbi:Uncharacterised protein [Burkholderia pseudomallei]|nr:Uncharacterised protein [Burkholderia pseudomallei]